MVNHRRRQSINRVILVQSDLISRKFDFCQTPAIGFPCIGLEIGLGHILCVISFLDIDMMTNLSIGIWNWIGVYVRPCLSSKVPKQGFPCIGLEIGFGHILRVISFIDIDMMASLSIGLGYI